MSQSTPQPNDRHPAPRRPWQPWVGFAESWVGFAPHHEQAGGFDLVGYQEPTWAMGRAIAAAVSNEDPRAVARISEVWDMCNPTASTQPLSLKCGSTRYGNPGHEPGSWPRLALTQSGTAVVSHDKDRSLSAGRACIVSAPGMTAGRPPLDGFITVATQAHV